MLRHMHERLLVIQNAGSLEMVTKEVYCKRVADMLLLLAEEVLPDSNVSSQ